MANQKKWHNALLNAQNIIAKADESLLVTANNIKTSSFVRFIHPPQDPQLSFPNHSQIGLYRQVNGTVIRISQAKLLEVKRDFTCSNCSTTITVDADFFLKYQFDVPKSCTTKATGEQSVYL